jgi:hypothetical protein
VNELDHSASFHFVCGFSSGLEEKEAAFAQFAISMPKYDAVRSTAYRGYTVFLVSAVVIARPKRGATQKKVAIDATDPKLVISEDYCLKGTVGSGLLLMD